jgi:SAM-dependent methyltransferase/uncharacterized protein YbaR (Trm112 family)
VLTSHFDQLQPVCPACRVTRSEESPLRLGAIATRHGDEILEGTLICSNAQCQREHPILDGIPIVLADPSSWFNQQILGILKREDLSPFTMSLLGDLSGASTPLDRERGNLAIYADSHWHPTDPGFLDFFNAASSLLPTFSPGPSIDIGCSLGRGTYELANQTQSLVVGLDLNFSMLRLAQRIRLTSKVQYERRRVGLVFDTVNYELPAYPADHVSFWCADVSILPFPNSTFRNMVALNMLDCASSPLGLLLEMGRTLAPNHAALLTTPFDWAVGASQPSEWIGGHSQRSSPHQGSSVEELRRFATHASFAIDNENTALPWRLRVHERSVTEYSVYAAALRRL